jgi:hypothetical protein
VVIKVDIWRKTRKRVENMFLARIDSKVRVMNLSNYRLIDSKKAATIHHPEGKTA